MESYGWDERELVRRCKEGSEAAYAELVRQHRQRLVNLAYRLTGSRETAEDVVQEAFLAAFRSIERFEPKPSVAPWLNTITVRLAGRAAARRASAPLASLDRLLGGDGHDDGSGGAGTPSLPLAFGRADMAPDPLAAAEAAELRRELSAAILELPFRQRAAVVLRYVIGVDYAEAARTMDVPLNTFKSHLLRGTRQLRASLGPGTHMPGATAEAAVQVAPADPDEQARLPTSRDGYLPARAPRAARDVGIARVAYRGAIPAPLVDGPESASLASDIDVGDTTAAVSGT